MKKALFLVSALLLAALFIVSCAPAAKYYVCQDGRQVVVADDCNINQPTTPAVAEPSPSDLPAGQPAPVAPDISQDAKALIDKSTKATGVQFSYLRSDLPNVENVYYASRQKMKVELINKAKFGTGDTYDTVYLDFNAKSARAFCEQASLTLCKDRNKGYDVSYDLYVINTPFDWLSKLTQANLTGRSKMIDGRTVQEMNFAIGTEKGVMFLDQFFGVPIEVNFQGIKYEFRNAVINEITPADLSHPIMSNSV